MKEIIDYIKQFLLFGNSSLLDSLGYTSNKQEWNKYRVVIIPNGLIADQSVEWQDQELVISPQVEQVNQTWIIHEDLIYLSLCCISLAGEHLERPLSDACRDIHQRIPSSESALGKRDLQLRPIVDEYATLVSRLIGSTMPTHGIQHVVLTHDVDSICRYRHLRGGLGGMRRGRFVDVVKSICNRENDPLFTFNWMHQQDKLVEGAEIIYFFKASNGLGYDYPQYNLHGNDFRALLDDLSNEKVKIGLHGSYHAAKELCYRAEKSKLEKSIKKKVTLHRNHYLRILSYEDLQCLVDTGITDDYSIGWADHVGFRLGTTRPVRWINPITFQLTDLVLHPLSIMDGTLSDNHYMNIQSLDKAFEICRSVIETIERYNGELVLLWHNSTFAEQNYHKDLYMNVINSLHQDKDNRMIIC